MQLEGQLHVPVVKNTFIEVMEPSAASARRMSLPAFLHLCRERCDGSDDIKRRVSDLSTVASTTSGSSSDSDEWATNSMVLDQFSLIPAVPEYVGSSGKATASCKPHHKARMDKVIRRVAKALEASDMIDKVEVASGSLIIQMHGTSNSLKQEVSALAQKTILEVTTQSKCIYAMGFASSSAFKMHANGFEVTLGAMENASRACWHVFKKGFCRHGDNCCKQHAVLETPLQVIVSVSNRC